MGDSLDLLFTPKFYTLPQLTLRGATGAKGSSTDGQIALGGYGVPLLAVVQPTLSFGAGPKDKDQLETGQATRTKVGFETMLTAGLIPSLLFLKVPLMPVAGVEIDHRARVSGRVGLEAPIPIDAFKGALSIGAGVQWDRTPNGGTVTQGYLSARLAVGIF